MISLAVLHSFWYAACMSDDFAPIGTAEPSKPDPIKDAAEELANDIIDVMRLLGKAHSILEKKGFGEATIHKFRSLSRQTYRNMQQDLPSMFRPELVQEIEAETFR